MTEGVDEGESCVPERRVLEDGLGKGLSQHPGADLAVLADPGQVSAEVDQELVVGLRDAGRLQDPLQPLPTLLHTLTLYRTKATPEWFLYFIKPAELMLCQMFFVSLCVPIHFCFYCNSIPF